jgi:uncharacterized protein involved in exopolysaccharide biosynthesis
LSIGDVIDFVSRYFWLVFVTTSSAIVLAVVYILSATPLYTATGQLQIDVKVPQLATEQWREVGMVLDSSQIESQIAVLKSEPVAEAVVRRLDLLNDPAYRSHAGIVTPPASAAPASGTAPTASDADQLRDAVRYAQSGLSIHRLGLAYILQVSYTTPDPAFAARAADAYMHAYIDDQIATRIEASRRGSEWLEKRINALRLQMNDAALKVQQFKARRDYSIVGSSPAGEDASKSKSNTPLGLNETLEELEATAMTYRRMFESALQAYTEAEQRQSYAVSNARILSSATYSVVRSYPKKAQALVVAIVAGLAFGFGVALLREGLRFAGASRTRRKAALQERL